MEVLLVRHMQMKITESESKPLAPERFLLQWKDVF